MIKLNLGCGNNLIPGFTNIDKYDTEADVLLDMCELESMFNENTVDEIVIYQALEHIPWHKTVPTLQSCYKVLKPDGKIIIEVPDIEVVAQWIISEGWSQKAQDNIYGGYHRPWDTGRYPDYDFHAGSIHYQCFTFQRLLQDLESVGFRDVVRQTMEEKHKDYKYEENLSVRAIK